MIFAKFFLSVLSIIVLIFSYLYILRILTAYKFPLMVNVILVSGAILLLALFSIVSIYIRRIRKYDVSRLDASDVQSISRFLSFVPIFFAILSVLIVVSISAYEYRTTRNITNFFNVIVFSVPIAFISYYLVKASLLETRLSGFFSFNRRNSVSILLSFLIVMLLNVLIGLSFVLISVSYIKKSLMIVVYVVVFSFITSLILFVWSLVLRLRYVIKILKVPEMFERYVPVLSNDEIGLISVYLDSILSERKQSHNFPRIYLGDKRVDIELGKHFCGCVWLKFFDIPSLFSEFSEKVMDDIQIAFARIESKVIESKGYIARFDGTEMYIVWGLDGTDWGDNLKQFVNFLYSAYKQNIFDNISVLKVGIASGRVFVGKTESIHGNLPYVFGEGIIESYVVGKYVKGDGFFASGEIKDLFGNYTYIDKVRVKELNKIVEIYRLFI